MAKKWLKNWLDTERVKSGEPHEIIDGEFKFKAPTKSSNRVNSSDEKIGPKYKSPVKVNKKEVPVETPEVYVEPSTGDIGSVDRTDDVIGPDMSKITKVDKEIANKIKDPREFTSMEMAQNLLSPGYNKKKGGAIKVKKMSSGGSTASKRADGIAQRGKTRGKMC